MHRLAERLSNLKIRKLKEQLEQMLTELEPLAELSELDIERGVNLQQEVRRFEVEVIQLALSFTGGHQRQAASLLQLKPTTLNAKMKMLGISCGRRSKERPRRIKRVSGGQV